MNWWLENLNQGLYVEAKNIIRFPIFPKKKLSPMQYDDRYNCCVQTMERHIAQPNNNNNKSEIEPGFDAFVEYFQRDKADMGFFSNCCPDRN